MKKILLPLFLLISLIGCKPKKASIDGIWRAEVPTIIGDIPFNLEIETTDDQIKVYAINGDEKLQMDDAHFEGDTLYISMEIFDAEIRAFVNENQMTGIYEKKLGNLSSRSGVFQAQKGEAHRFIPFNETAKHNVSGKWQTVFMEPEGGEYEAIGVFQQKGNEVTGTFLTTTGDYRFLAGNVVEDSLMLSCFDGTHIFLFKAQINGEKLEGGRFSSSLLYHETWEATKNEGATIADPDSLTYIKNGFDEFNFAFTNTKGEMVSISDERYQDKVVLVQILGSWCPNCMDESKFYVNWLKNNPQFPVEVIGLAFEKSLDHAFAFPKIDKMKERFGMEYEVLLAGTNEKGEAEKALPMLNKIMSYPTTIYLDKKHHVRKIHTGFSGPGTGEYHEKFKEEFDLFVKKLASEE